MNKLRKVVIAGNWKMNLNLDEAVKFLYEVNEHIPSKDRVDSILLPQYPALNRLNINKDRNLSIGAQNMHFKDSGAFTGEVSPLILKQLGIAYVLVGHSERRQYYNETNTSVNLKIHAAINHGIAPIFCIGEMLEAREKGSTNIVLARQLYEGLKDVSAENTLKIIIAYEPVWAIGTGKTATNEQANDTIKAIRRMLKKLYGKAVSESIRILYGGSVNTGNIEELLKMSDIDGVLVGGASIKSDSFNYLLAVANKLVG